MLLVTKIAVLTLVDWGAAGDEDRAAGSGRLVFSQLDMGFPEEVFLPSFPS